MATDYEQRVRRLKTADECRRMERNALERGREDIARLARQRRVELSADRDIAGDDHDDPIREELWRALQAYEQVLG